MVVATCTRVAFLMWLGSPLGLFVKETSSPPPFVAVSILFATRGLDISFCVIVSNGKRLKQLFHVFSVIDVMYYKYIIREV